MFNTNQFKKKIKKWIEKNPNSPIEELIDYSESLIPHKDLIRYYWIIHETKNWYTHYLKREKEEK